MIKTSELAGMLRRVSSRLVELDEKVAEYEKSKRVSKLMAKMSEKGIQTDLDEEAQFEHLMKKAEEGRLDAIEEAVQLSGGASTVKIASDDGSGEGKPSDASAAELESFLMTG